MIPFSRGKRGARSIQGAMGTYAWVSAAVVLLLGLVLWFGPDRKGRATEVTLAPGWQAALLEDGSHAWELHSGEVCALPSGSYRLTLFTTDGTAVRRTVDVRGEAMSVGASGD